MRCNPIDSLWSPRRVGIGMLLTGHGVTNATRIDSLTVYGVPNQHWGGFFLHWTRMHCAAGEPAHQGEFTVLRGRLVSDEHG